MTKLKKYVSRFFLFLLIPFAVLVLAFFLMTLNNCRKYFSNEAESLATKYTSQVSDQLGNVLSHHRETLQQVLHDFREQKITEIEEIDKNGEQEDFDRFADSVLQTLGCVNLRLVSGTRSVYSRGETRHELLSDELLRLVENGELAYTPTYYDESMGENTLALYCPVSLYDSVTGLVLYYPADKFFSLAEPLQKPLLYSIASRDGAILTMESDPELPTDVSHNLITYLYNISTSKPSVEALKEALESGQKNAVTKISIRGTSYICAFSYISDWGNRCYILNLYKESDLLKQEHNLYGNLYASAILLAVFVVFLIVLFFLSRKGGKEGDTDIESIDPTTGGNSADKFQLDATRLLDANQFTKFAVIYASIDNYDYLKENLTEEQHDSMLRFLSNIMEKSIILNESYGHISEDKFAMLMHYSEPSEVTRRIRILSNLANNYEDFKKLGHTLKLNIGIFMMARGNKIGLSNMLERAMIANQDNQKRSGEPYSIFDNKIQSTYLREAELESKQEYALQNHDFKLFFQPIYNVREDRIQSAEVLVRWYDSKTQKYISPADFVPLFEINGFVNKMDRFVFEEVCSFMNQASRRGDKLTHCNINVSHVTASQPDFVEFYAGKKREYGIPNGYLTLEFSESFAFKNYDAMKHAVIGLRNAGIGCTIDDFGSAFTSYHVLKELPMSELKLHRFFIWEKGDEQRDHRLLESTIALGKACDMMVIQGGVETREQLELVKSMGCDLIQGFYYAKPMLMSDFIDFVNRGTDLKNVLAHQ